MENKTGGSTLFRSEKEMKILLTIALIVSVAVASAQPESPQQLIARYTLQIQTQPDSISGYINRAIRRGGERLQ
jgi:hypothetical protein